MSFCTIVHIFVKLILCSHEREDCLKCSCNNVIRQAVNLVIHQREINILSQQLDLCHAKCGGNSVRKTFLSKQLEILTRATLVLTVRETKTSK